MCTVRKIPNLLTRIKKHSLLNSSRSPAVTELFANVNVNDKRESRQKRAVNAFEPPVEKHRVVFTGRAFWTIQRSGLVFFLLFSPLFSFFHSTPPHPFGQSSWRGAQRRRTTGTLYFHHPRRDRSICFAAGIACLAATSFLSYLLCVPSPFLPFPRSLVDAHTLWQIRPLDESTRRYLDISTGTRLIRPGDVFIHRDRLFHFDEWRDAALRFQRSEHICNWPLSVKSTRKYADRELFVKVFFFLASNHVDSSVLFFLLLFFLLRFVKFCEIYLLGVYIF